MTRFQFEFFKLAMEQKMITVHIYKSNRKDKRYMAIFDDLSRVHFGSPDYQNFSIHKDEGRKRMYIIRHSANEDWTKTGLKTPGFWSKHLLWNFPTINQSIRDIEQKFNIRIINKISS
jgi:uncharacterized protein YcgL (UPF0745 family)